MKTRLFSLCFIAVSVCIPLLSANAQITSGGTYGLRARHSGKFLDAYYAATTNRTKLTQGTWNGGNNQKWVANNVGGNQYTFIGVQSGRAVDVDGATTADIQLQLWDANGSVAQKWAATATDSGYYKLLNVNSGKAMDVFGISTADGAAVFQSTWNGGANQQWLFVQGPAGYTYCVGEGGSYSFGQTVDLAFGANGKFNYQNGVTGTRVFSTSTFGDPVPGVVKAGFYKVSTGGGPAGFAYCAPENGSFTFNQTVNAAYGANGSFRYKSNVSGTITFNNANFSPDPISGVVKAGYFQVIPPAPPNPPSLSTASLNTFINSHAQYENGSAAGFSSVFQNFLQKMGGDRFCTKLYAKWPNQQLSINSSISGLYSTGGNTYLNKGWWDSNADISRVAILMHEYMHHMDNGSGVASFYNAAVADANKQWDSYAMNSTAEYIASGFEWIVNNQMHNASDNNRQTIYRMDPAFYLYMVNTFIPSFYQ